jgi:hypothetical protein
LYLPWPIAGFARARTATGGRRARSHLVGCDHLVNGAPPPALEIEGGLGRDQRDDAPQLRRNRFLVRLRLHWLGIPGKRLRKQVTSGCHLAPAVPSASSPRPHSPIVLQPVKEVAMGWGCSRSDGPVFNRRVVAEARDRIVQVEVGRVPRTNESLTFTPLSTCSGGGDLM